MPALRPSSGWEAFPGTGAPGRAERTGVALIHQALQLLQTAEEAAQRSRHVYTTAQQRPSGQNRWKPLYMLIYTVWHALTQAVLCSGRGWNWHIYGALWKEFALLSIIMYLFIFLVRRLTSVCYLIYKRKTWPASCHQEFRTDHLIQSLTRLWHHLVATPYTALRFRPTHFHLLWHVSLTLQGYSLVNDPSVLVFLNFNPTWDWLFSVIWVSIGGSAHTHLTVPDCKLKVKVFSHPISCPGNRLWQSCHRPQWSKQQLCRCFPRSHKQPPSLSSS